MCAGRNTLAIANTASEGPLGMPPWFMVAECVIGGKDVELHARLPIEQDFVVTLPKETRPIPEPLAEGKKPGFALRGTKGWLWKPEQYLAEIPTLVRCKMNFMMICYGSMCDIERCAWGAPECNRWWEPLPEDFIERCHWLLALKTTERFELPDYIKRALSYVFEKNSLRFSHSSLSVEGVVMVAYATVNHIFSREHRLAICSPMPDAREVFAYTPGKAILNYLRSLGLSEAYLRITTEIPEDFQP